MKTYHLIVSTLAAALLTAIAANATDLVWIGGTGNWNSAGNWSPAQVPTAADNAIITSSGTYTVTVPAGSTATAGSILVGGASGAQTLAIDRATLTIGGASLIDTNGQLSLLVAQSTLTGAGSLTVNGILNWANGTMSGAGTTTIGSSGILSIGSGGVTSGRTLNNGGIGTWSGGNLTMSAGAVFNNLAGGTFDVTADGRLSGSATTPINNSGLFRQTAGTAGTIITAPFNNGGTLAVLAQTLNLNLGGTHTGIMSNALGATLNFGGGSHVLTGSSFVTGPGVLSLSGGATTLTAGGTFDVTGSTLNINTGTATLSSSCNITGTTLNIGGTGGTVLYNSAGSVAAVNITAGTLATLGGINPVTVTGPLTLGGGKITNAIVTANGGLFINGNVTLNGAKLVNPGTAIWSAGNITGLNGSVISNLLGATFINTFDGSIATGAGATPIFVNAGSFQKAGATAPAGTTSIDFQFINTGTVEVQTNTLRYTINQQTAGLTLLDGGGLSAQSPQPLQFLGGSLVGTGLVTVANTVNILNSSTISPGLPLGELDISGNYQQTASGNLNIELGGYLPATGFDLVTVTAGGAGGVATLGGTLNVTLTNGFSPTNGATFTFLTAASRVGAFSTFNYPSNDIGMQLILTTTSASVKITNLKPVVANPIVAPAPVTYGAALNFQFPANTFTDPDGDTLAYTASGMPPGITFTGATRTFSGNPSQAGVFNVTVVANDGGFPSLIATNSFTITVNPAPLAITAQPQTKIYGSADPALTFAAIGLQFSDTPATVLSGALARVAGETVAGGPYAITQGTLTANGNYSILFAGDVLTITPATLSIVAQPKTKTYGATDPALTFATSGLQFSDTAVTVLTGRLTRVTGETVAGSPYAITIGTLTANSNYAISFTGTSFAITPAALTVAANAKSKIYGSTLTLNGAADFTPTGLLNGETISSVTLLASGSPTGTAATASVGSYNITPSAATGGTFTAANYAITYTAGTLTVKKAALSVTADAQTKVYGAADPVFTANYSGFVNSETSGVIGGTLAFARVPGENVGSYLITPSGVTSPNYTITFNTGLMAITPATLTITASAKDKTYGATLTPDGAADFTSTGLLNGETIGSVTLAASGSPAGTLASAPAGAYTITPSAATGGTFNAANYSITYTPGTLTVNKAALSITADAQTKVYGVVDPVFTATYSGFVNSETPAVLGGTLTLARAPGENVGSYLITPSGLTSGNYTVAFNTGTLVITKAPLSVTADARTKTYGSADPLFTVTYSGFVIGETAAVLGGTLTFNRAPGENVGGYTITPSGLTSVNYAITFNTGSLAINKAALTVTADAKTKIYGAVDPALTFAVSGVQFADTALTVLTGALTRAPGATAAGGPYAITQGTLAPNGNYTLNFTGNTLAIDKAALSVTADAKTKVYGAADPAFTATYTGFVNGETSAVLGGTLAFVRAPGENVGGYLITPSGQTSGNYTITFNTGTLSITKAVLSVTANPINKTYGATDPALTYTTTGLQFTDTAGAVLTGVLTRVGGETVAGSPYTITQGTLAPNGNYTVSFTGNTLTITKAALSVTADAKTKSYGAADPVFTATYAGFVNGETPAVLGGALTLTRATGETVGSYVITAGSQTSGNYAITFNTGSLNITKAVLSVTVNAKTKVYGAADPALTFTTTGLQFSDTEATVLTGALARTAGETVAGSPYAITQGTLIANGNYTVSFTGNTLSITKAPLSVTADGQSKTYGAADPGLTVKLLGLQFSDTTATVLTGALTRTAGETVAGSPYAITQGTLTANGNYSINFTAGSLAITPATLTITAQPKTKTYGAADPALTFTTSGLQFSDTTASVLTGALTRAAGETVAGSPYGITRGTLAATSNYTISFTASTLAITPAALTVTASAKSKTYGATLTLNGAVDFTSTGLLNGETIGSVTLAASGSPAGTAATAPVGGYTITPSAAIGGTFTAANYAITYTTGTLTVSKAAISVTADAKTKIYGAVDPTFTATDSGFVNGETAAVLGGRLAFARAPGENVGSYMITPGGLTSSNYTITFNTGTLAINKATLTVTADAKTKTYGALDPALTFVVSGLQFSDAPGAVLTGSLTRVAGETVAGGPYTITQGTLAPNGNYLITFAGSTLTIGKAALSVTADAKAKVYGAADPAFTATYTGFVNGETAAVLGGTLSLARAPGENVGSYLITPSGQTSGNYAITFNTGTLSITKASLSIAADAKTKVYGAADPVLTFTPNGLQFADTPAGVLTGVLTRVAGETVTGGPYAITQGTLMPNGNYTISFTGSSLTITMAALSVTADAKTKALGAADPTFTASYVGFIGSESPTVLGGTLAFSRSPGEAVGTYLITPAGLTSGNYAITFNAGSMTIIAPAPALLPLARLGTSNVIITWTSASNGVYRVQYNPTLGSTNWTDLVGDVTATNSTASKTDIMTTTNRFYRIRVLP